MRQINKVSVIISVSRYDYRYDCINQWAYIKHQCLTYCLEKYPFYFKLKFVKIGFV